MSFNQLRTLYTPAAALLGEEFWRRADNIAATEMMRFLGADLKTVKHNQERRQKISALLRAVKQTSQSATDATGRYFLGHLGGKFPAKLPGAWRADTRVTLHYQDFDHFYLLSPRAEDVEIDQLRYEPPGLWLTLGEHRDYALPDETLYLSADDILRLAQTKSAHIPIALNQIAGIQHKVQADKVFRTVGGLPGEMIVKHFAGRDQEIDQIRRCLEQADGAGGSGAAALIVSGRRMGKTTLRQRLEYLEGQKHSARLIVVLNFESVPEYSGIALFHWFWDEFRERTRGLDLGTHHISRLDWLWPEREEENSVWMGRQQRAVRAWLSEVKKHTGYALLLTLDETDHLVRRDVVEKQGESFRIFRFLRDLLAEGRLCLIATAYPHGASRRDSLAVFNNQSGTPLFNTFSTLLPLLAWPPDTTWKYLHDRLAGLGVILPESCRESLLAATRGVPWMVHALGLALCAGTDGRRRLVLPDDWRTALDALALQVHNELVTTVRGETENCAVHHTDAALPPLEANQLLHKLFQLAKEKMPATVGQDWGKARFTLRELAGKFEMTVAEERLREVLKRLTSTMVLEGDTAEEDVYYFGAGMLVGAKGESGDGQ